MPVRVRLRRLKTFVCLTPAARFVNTYSLKILKQPRREARLFLRTLFIIKKYINMEQTKMDCDMDAQEIKRLWQQLAIGTIIALAGLLLIGIGEAVARWIEYV